DGWLDLVVSASGASNILYRNTNGTNFIAIATIPPATNTSAFPTRALAADFNGDGREDLMLAATNTNPLMVGYYLNTGGNFSQLGSLPMPNAIVPNLLPFLVMGDFLNDGFPDLLSTFRAPPISYYHN